MPHISACLVFITWLMHLKLLLRWPPIEQIVDIDPQSPRGLTDILVYKRHYYLKKSIFCFNQII